MAKKYDLALLPDEFTTDDFVEKFNVKKYQANKTIKYWLAKGYIIEKDGKYLKNNLAQEVKNDSPSNISNEEINTPSTVQEEQKEIKEEVENTLPKTEESVVEKKEEKQEFKAHVTGVEVSSDNESVNDVIQKFKAHVAGVEIFVEAKSANEVINIIVSKYGYPDKAIKKIEKI